ncbi:MAG: ATP-binding protein [candidate division KSB1 bacterium]|nr:ATP-binding protein [candidate division KSB1 bacterium]
MNGSETSKTVSFISLKTRLIIYTVIIILSFSLCVGGFFYIISEKAMLQNLQHWADSYTDNFAFYLRDVVTQRDTEKINDFIRTARNDSRILYVVVLNKFGTPIAEYDPGDMYQDMFFDRDEVRSQQMLEIEHENRGKHFRFIRAIEGPEGDDRAGTVASPGFLENPMLLLGISPVSMQQRMDSWIKQAILIIGALLLIFITISVILMDRASLPLKELTTAARAIGQGNLSIHVKHQSHDEIGLVAASFNSMIEQLKESREQLRRYTDNLEHEIEKRTADLKQSELKYRTLFEHSGTALALIAPDNSLIMVNHQFRRLSGLSGNEIERINDFSELFDNADQKDIEQIMVTARSSEYMDEPLNCESVLKTGDDVFQRVNLNVSLLPNTLIVLANMTDVTQIRELQNQLNRTQHLAEVGEMSASLAHEIRNPLGAINASIDVLEQSLELDGDEHILFKIIGEETMRVNRIITDFLQFARIQKAELEPVHVNDLLIKEINAVKADFGEVYKIETVLETDVDTIEADSRQIAYVIKSILENAVEAMPEGGKIEITSSMQQDYIGRDQVQFTIKDNGPGFDQDKLQKIVQPFYTTKDKGIGMGMAISERIVQHHNGFIRFKSSAGNGLQVSISLPV